MDANSEQECDNFRSGLDKFGSSDDLFIDRCSLFIERSADSSGNALGFTPSSAITEYLYNQQYYDVISGQYYMRARNYDPATGTFTQQGSYTINPGDLANANLYLYAGGDPINMFDPSGHDYSIGSLAVGIGIASLLNAGIGGIVGGVQNGILGAVGGFANGLISTSLGFTASLGIGPSFGFAFGAMAGEAVDLMIQNKPLSLGEWWADEAVSGIFGFIGGFIGGSVAVNYAGEIGSRLLDVPQIRSEVAEITARQGLHLLTAVNFVNYYADHPSQFGSILFKFVTDKTVGEAAFESVKAIIAGLAVGKVQGAATQALIQPATNFIDAIDALVQNAEKNFNSNN